MLLGLLLWFLMCFSRVLLTFVYWFYELFLRVMLCNVFMFWGVLQSEGLVGMEVADISTIPPNDFQDSGLLGIHRIGLRIPVYTCSRSVVTLASRSSPQTVTSPHNLVRTSST